MKTFMTKLLATSVLCLAATNALSAGFEQLLVPLEGGRQAVGGIWYPSLEQPRQVDLGPYPVQIAAGGALDGESLPLVVLSHGSGGTHLGHIDTAIALADAGFVVAAITHPADNFEDDSGYGTPRQLIDRVRDLSSVVDYLTRSWRQGRAVDSERIGAFGFSAGGYAVLTAAGARPVFSRLPRHCRESPHDHLCSVLLPRWDSMKSSTPPGPDGRIKVAVVAAPALGHLFAEHSLRDLRVKLQLWSAEKDDVLPHRYHAGPVAAHVARNAEHRQVKGAGHFVFLAPCSPRLTELAPSVCRDADGFDRREFHKHFNREVVRFFSEGLHLPTRRRTIEADSSR